MTQGLIPRSHRPELRPASFEHDPSHGLGQHDRSLLHPIQRLLSWSLDTLRPDIDSFLGKVGLFLR